MDDDELHTDVLPPVPPQRAAWRGESDSAYRERLHHHKALTAQRRAKERQSRNTKQDRDDEQSLQHQLLIDVAATLARSQKRLLQLQQYEDALSRHLDRLLAGEFIELDADGRLADADAEEAAQHHETATGTRIDRLNPIHIKQALEDFTEAQAAINAENERLLSSYGSELAAHGLLPLSLPATADSPDSTDEKVRPDFLTIGGP